jgi:hypothetical protein
MYFWYGFVFIWNGIGMWMSAFGTLYAIMLPRLFILASSTRPIVSLLCHPTTLNELCFVPPIVLLTTQLVTSTYSSIAWSNVVHTQFELIDLLTTLASQWGASGGRNINDEFVTRANQAGALFLVQKEVSLTAFQRNAGTCES